MTLNISSRLSGVLHAKSRVPSGDSASGRTGPLSNSTKEVWASAPIAKTTSRADNRNVETVRTDFSSTGRPPDCEGGSRAARAVWSSLAADGRKAAPPGAERGR